MMGNRWLILVATVMSFLLLATACGGGADSVDEAEAATDDDSPASPSAGADSDEESQDRTDDQPSSDGADDGAQAEDEPDPDSGDEDAAQDGSGDEDAAQDGSEDDRSDRDDPANRDGQDDPAGDDEDVDQDQAGGNEGQGESEEEGNDDGEGDELAATPQGLQLVAVGPEDSGDEVAAVQERLAELGFAPGPADGDYGRRTEVAVETFQAVVGLPETGRVNYRTIDALETYRYTGLSLAAGDEGPEVEELQARLATGPFDPGQADGEYGQATVAAIWALEKLAGIPIDGDWGPADEMAWDRLMDGEIGRPQERHDQRWVEVDLSMQLMMVYEPDRTTPVLVSHISSGSGIPWENEEYSGSSVTPLGEFHINRRIAGWRESSLNIGRLYNPLYFNGGIAFHGATSVPLYPASHGCVRVPMHIAEYLPDELPNGTPVHVLA